MKLFLTILGFFFLGLAVLGAILPVMPTTCFVLAAAGCFAKSSDRFYQWLLASRLFGPIIRNWQATRSMPRRAKIIAITSIVCSGAISIFMIHSSTIQALVVALLLIPIGIILKIPTTEELGVVSEKA
jgi:uncharacterized membrane protein YbaN (DUF454 family)